MSDEQQVRGAGAHPEGVGDPQPESDESERAQAGGAGGGEGVQPVDATGFPAFIHWCEKCGLELLLTPEIAYQAGWDFPPKMGVFGVISPRTCGNCTMEGTVWYALAIEKKSSEQLTDKQYNAALRILKEKDDPRLGGRVGAGAAGGR